MCMQFRKYLSEDSVFLDRDFNSLEEVLIFLSEVFARRTGLDKGFIHNLLAERENTQFHLDRGRDHASPTTTIRRSGI